MLKLSWVMNSRWPEDEGHTQLWKKSWDDRESSLACMEQEGVHEWGNLMQQVGGQITKGLL